MATWPMASCQSPKNLATLLKPCGESAHTQGKSHKGCHGNPHRCKYGSCLLGTTSRLDICNQMWARGSFR